MQEQNATSREFYEKYAYICEPCNFACMLGDILPDEPQPKKPAFRDGARKPH